MGNTSPPKAKPRRSDPELRLYLPDGTRAAPLVVATYGRGMGLSELTTSRADLAAHVTSAFDTKLWTKGGTTAGLAPLGTALDRQLNA